MNHPKPRPKTLALLASVLLFGALPLFAQQETITLRDQTPVYVHSIGDKVEFTVGKNSIRVVQTTWSSRSTRIAAL